jgi:hypothetical protein
MSAQTSLKMHGNGPRVVDPVESGFDPTNAVVQSASITVNVTNVTNQAYEIFVLAAPVGRNQVTWNAAATEPTGGRQGRGRPIEALPYWDRSPPTTASVTFNLNAAGSQVAVDQHPHNNGIVFQTTPHDGLDLTSEVTTAANRPSSRSHGLGTASAAAARQSPAVYRRPLSSPRHRSRESATQRWPAGSRPLQQECTMQFSGRRSITFRHRGPARPGVGNLLWPHDSDRP